MKKKIKEKTRNWQQVVYAAYKKAAYAPQGWVVGIYEDGEIGTPMPSPYIEDGLAAIVPAWDPCGFEGVECASPTGKEKKGSLWDEDQKRWFPYHQMVEEILDGDDGMDEEMQRLAERLEKEAGEE